MSNQVAISTAVERAAVKAVFEHQYNSQTAAKFIRSEVPGTSFELALQAIDMVARPAKRK